MGFTISWSLIDSLCVRQFGAEARSRESTLSSLPTPSKISKIQLGRMRDALETSIRLREHVVEGALAARHNAKRECRKLQSYVRTTPCLFVYVSMRTGQFTMDTAVFTQFMHSIATMMTTLSQRSKRGNISVPDTSFLGGRYDTAPASPGGRAGWGYYSRPLYPATQVNLGYLPPTQQLSTPSFPIGVEPGSTSPRMVSSPSVRLISKPEIREAIPELDTSTSIDLPSPDRWSHAAFPVRRVASSLAWWIVEMVLVGADICIVMPAPRHQIRRPMQPVRLLLDAFGIYFVQELQSIRRCRFSDQYVS